MKKIDRISTIPRKIEELEDRYLAEERHRTDSGERISLDEMMRRYAADLKAGE